MSSASLYLLLLAALCVYIGFAVGFLYLKRWLRKEHQNGFRLIVPVFFSFAMGITLLMIAFSQL